MPKRTSVGRRATSPMLEDLDIHEDAENQSPNAGLIGTPLKRSKMFEEPQVGELKLFSADETLRFVLNPKLDQPASDEKASSMIVQTLASVPNDSSASGCNVQAVYSADGFFMLSGSQIYMLDSALSTHHATIYLDDCEPEIIAINSDSTFLVAGDRNGVVHFIHIESKAVIFSQELLSASQQNRESFAFQHLKFSSAPRVSDGTEDLFVVLFNNVMLRFSNVNLGRLKQFIATGDKKIALDVKKAIIVEKIEVNTQHPEGILFLQEYRDSYGDSKLLTIGKGQSGIAKWGRQMSTNGDNTELCETACCDEFSLKHKWFTLPNIVFAQMCGRFLISVDCEQSMSIWDVDTLIKLYHIPNTAVQSFVVAHSENGFDHWMQLKIVALQTDNQLRIIQLPSMKVELSVPVSGQRCFLAQPQVGDKTNWANLFIEQTDGNSLVRSIGDADPRHFLNQLVRKAKFDVAKQYAATHGLDVEEFIKANLSHLLETDLCIKGRMKTAADSVITDLKSITDDAFALDFCLNALFADYKSAHQILQFAVLRIYEINKRINESSASSVAIDFVFKMLKRLATFRSISGGDYCSDEWHRFRSCNLMKELSNWAAKSRMDNVITIWRRHSQDEPFIDSINDLLYHLPPNLSLDDYFEWIRDDILPVISHNSEMQSVHLWLQDRARIIEMNLNDPRPAHKLVKLLGSRETAINVGIIHPQTPAYYVDVALSRPVNADMNSDCLPNNHRLLLDQFEDLVYLLECHDFRISLNDYDRLSKSSIAIELMNRVAAVELLQQAIDVHVLPYIQKHDLSKDDVMADYAAELMEKCKISEMASSSTEPRVILILSNIASVDVRLNVLVHLLRQTAVPWSVAIDELLSSVDSFKSAQSFGELVELKKLMELKRTLYRYNVTSLNISDLSMANGYLRMILSDLESAEAMEDSLLVVAAYHHLDVQLAFVARLRYLSLAGRLSDKIGHLISLIDCEILTAVFRQFFIWGLDYLEELGGATKNESAANEQNDYCRLLKSLITAGEHFLAYYAKTGEDCEDIFSQTLNRLRKMSFILEDYAIVASLSEIQSPERCIDIIQNYSRRLLIELNEDPVDALRRGNIKLLRLAELVGISREHLTAALGLAMVNIGEPRKALDLCEDLLRTRMTAPLAKLFSKIISSVALYCADNCSCLNSDVVQKLEGLAASALVWIPADSCADALEMFKNLEILRLTFDQCQSGDYKILVEGVPDSCSSSSSVNDGNDKKLPAIRSLGLCDKYGSNLFDGHFYENSLVMRTEETLTIAADFLFQSCRPQSEKQSGKNSGMKLASSRNAFIDHLLNNRAYQTCLRVFQVSIEQQVRTMSGDKNIDWETDFRKYHKIMDALLNKNLAHSHIDSAFAFSCMMALPQKAAFDGLKGGLSTVNNEFHRLTKIAGIGLGAATLWQQRTFTVQLETLAKNSRWWNQFNLLNISFQEDRFRTDPTYLRDLVVILLDKTGLDILTVLEFTSDYNIEDDFALLEYIRQCFTEPDLSDQECFSRIAGAAEDVVNKMKLSDTLKDLMQIISPYAYERIRFVFEIILKTEPEDQVAKKGISILDVLSNFNRNHQPSDDEVVSVLTRYPELRNSGEKSRIDFFLKHFPAAGTRLPYHETVMNPWTILAVELSEQTIFRLVPLALPLGIPSDKFYLVVVNNLLQRLKIENHLDSAALNKIFIDVKGIMLKIKDATTSIGTWLHVAEAFPPGTDRIQSYKTAQILVDKWQRQLSTIKDGSAKEKMVHIEGLSVKLRKQLLEAETEYQLRSEQLNDYSKLIEDPQELIIKLYSDMEKPAVCECIENASLDLHHACDRIAQRYGLEINDIRKMLFQEWMRLPTDAISSTETTLPSMRFHASLHPTNDSNPASEFSIQRKLVHLLSAFEMKEAVTMLLKVAYDGSQKITTTRRIRSLSALFKIASDADIDSIHNCKEVREYLRTLLYLIDCEELRISVRARELYSIEKDALARSLWVSRSEEPRVVLFICNLLLDFSVFEDIALWENVLKKLLQSKQFEVLPSVLIRISSQPELVRMERLPEIWRATLIGCFRATLGDGHNSLDQIFHLMEQCPFESAVDTRALSEIFTSIDLFTAIQCLSKLYRITREQTAMDAMVSAITLINEPQQLMLAAKLTKQPETLRLLYNRLDDLKAYAVMLAEPVLFLQFVEALVKQDRIDNLLRCTEQLKMPQRCVQLLQLYFKYWPNHAPAADEMGDYDKLAKRYREVKSQE